MLNSQGFAKALDSSDEEVDVKVDVKEPSLSNLEAGAMGEDNSQRYATARVYHEVQE